MDKLRQMRALVTVAKLGSFSEAAKSLGVTPGMMSKQVKYLEDALDVRLLHRTTRGVSVTEAGERYIDRAIEILERVDDAESEVMSLSTSPRGMLRISCPPSFGTHVLTPVIAEFVASNPDVSVELGLQDDEPNVIAERLDLIFRLGSLRDSSLIAKQVGQASFALCAAPGFVAQHGAPKQVSDLPAFNCIVDGSIQADRQWDFVVNRKRVEQPVAGNFSSFSTEAVIEASAAGLGISYVPRYAIKDELEAGRLLELRLSATEPISLPIYALHGSREHIAAKIKLFLAFYSAASSDVRGIVETNLERRSHAGSARSPDSNGGPGVKDEIAT